MNKAQVIGNLGSDPEIRYTQQGTPVATFSIASTERWKGQDGQQQEHTEWHRIVVWRRLAETCNEYLKKGSKVYIEGKMQTRKWQDQQGNDRYTTEIIGTSMEMLSCQRNNAPENDPGPPPGHEGEDVPF
jgi:single-strand DNA-binding protein